MVEILEAKVAMTAEEYLERERNTLREDGGKHQYFKNKRILMAGGTKKHDRIVSNIHGMLFTAISDWPVPTVSTIMTSKPAASHNRIVSRV